MNTYQMATRLLRHCQTRDLSALPLDDLEQVAGAMSAAIGEFFRLAPALYRRTTMSASVTGPATVSIAVSAGAVSIDTGGSNPFTDLQRGATLEIAGDGRYNEIVSPSGWLNPYQGTSGTKTATIHGDSVPIHSRLVERLLTDPVLVEPAGVTRRLIRQEIQGGQDGWRAWYWEHWRSALAFGEPTHYAIEHGGASHGSDLNFLIRLHPMPTRAYVLNFEAHLAPATYPVGALTTTGWEDLPLSNDVLESMVLPIAEENMLGTTLWASEKPAVLDHIHRAADRGRALTTLLPAESARRVGRVGTPPGY